MTKTLDLTVDPRIRHRWKDKINPDQKGCRECGNPNPHYCHGRLPNGPRVWAYKKDVEPLGK